jgi:hypothetical protein
MSEDRDKNVGKFANDEAAKDDVEAHRKMKANEEAPVEAGESDVEAHMKVHKG